MRYLVLLIGLCCAACSSPKLVGSEDVAVVAPSDLPEPTRNDWATPPRQYVIGPYDKLAIDVAGMPDLQREVQADSNGWISFPLAGQLDAAGKTTLELAQLIEERMRTNFVRNPQVTVNLLEAMSQTVAVDGQVARPGVYAIRSHMTLMRAVATAGGATEFARNDYVVLFRSVGGQNLATLHSLASIRQGLYPDPEIYPDDFVLVGESNARRIFRDVMTAASVLVSPVAVILQ